MIMMALYLFCVITFLYLIGRLGVLAQAECEAGSFGLHCQLKCTNCVDLKCNPNRRVCPCKPGFYGKHCQFDDNCIYDHIGITYKGHRSKTVTGLNCVAWGDVTDVIKRFQKIDVVESKNYCRNPELNSGQWGSSLWCYVSVSGETDRCGIRKCGCPDFLYGSGCTEQCHCRDKTEKCSENGQCPKSGCADGWIGSSCNEICRAGYYGRACQLQCPKCVGSACDPQTGKCLNGCPKGFTGDFCDQECQGFYGLHCQTPCGNCLNGGQCDPMTGHCNKGCTIGFHSSSNTYLLCDKACQRDLRYGQNCAHECGVCKNLEPCDPVTGVCRNGCETGYSTDKCTACPSHYYGHNCAKKCGVCKDNSTCDSFTGRCLAGCAVGHEGFLCVQRVVAKSDTTHVAIGAGLSVGFLLIIIMLIIFLLYRRRQHKKNLDVTNRSIEYIHDPMDRDESCQLLGDSRVGSEPASVVREEEDNVKNEDHIYANLTNRKQTSPVQVPLLYDYIIKNKERNQEGFKKEFEELPIGLLAKSEVARKPENKVKNRYGNIVAYDHSRVVLDPIPGESYSDYVNANFMDGYARPKAYIASQGPNKVMIRDFWRMVWQQRVSKIVMLTNLMEACKKKCEQYWPDEGSSKYGDLTVLLVNTTKYTDFIIRTFELSKEMENSRIVKQFHFTTWSDHGAPTYPTTLLAFRRKVQSFKPDDTAPILSHCSAGIGRTGTYIALNYLLDQAVAENEVDVLSCAQLMRSNRVNMIQTLEQYVFVYDALMEAIISGNTTIPRSTFHSTYDYMVSLEGDENAPLEKQYDVLQLLSPNIEREECSSACMEENMSKNRFKNILPANRSRPFLYTPVDGCNDYINAVCLSGYSRKDQFIVTQMPLPETVADFWRMLYDTSSDIIIMLNEFDRNDKSCALYWPEEHGYSEEHGPLSVELLSSSEADPDVTIRAFMLSHLDKGEERAIKQFMFKSWPDYQTTPNSVTPLLRLHRKVNDWLKQNSKGPVTIHCMNGASKSGVVAAMCILLEQLELDFEVDVYQTAKQIRTNRPQFIENLKQYKFLYQIVQEYMDSE